MVLDRKGVGFWHVGEVQGRVIFGAKPNMPQTLQQLILIGFGIELHAGVHRVEPFGVGGFRVIGKPKFMRLMPTPPPDIHEAIAERRGRLVVQQGLQILIYQTECANFRQHLAQANTRLGNHGELTHSASRTIKECLILGCRAADELAAARNHFPVLRRYPLADRSGVRSDRHHSSRSSRRP